MSKKQAVRLAVVENNTALSSVWRIWRNGSDIYVAIRAIAHTFKTSLHRSGIHRHAFVSQSASDQFPGPRADRATKKWIRPAEQRPGQTLLFQIIIPESGLLASTHGQALPADTVCLPRPQPGNSMFIMVLVAGAGVQMRSHKTIGRGSVHASWPDEDGTTTWAFANEVPTPKAIDAEVAEHRERFKKLAATPYYDLPGDLRGFLIWDSSDGVGRLVDFALEPPRLTVVD